MKSIVLIGVIFFASGLSAATVDPRVASRQLSRPAIDLFAAGNSAGALAHLRSNVRSENNPDGTTTALVQSLVEIASSLYNQRRITLAREVVAQAFAAADPILNGRSPAPAARRASILSSLGLLSEMVLLDLKRAGDLYTAAEGLNPADRLHSERKKNATDKQKLVRNGGGS